AGDTGSWGVTRYREQIQAGDVVLLWQAGEQGGLYAIGRVTRQLYPCHGCEYVSVFTTTETKSEWCVDFEYERVLARPLTRGALKQHPILRRMRIITAPSGTHFRVLPREWEALGSLLFD